MAITPLMISLLLPSYPSNSSGCENLLELFRNVDPPQGGTGLKVLPRPSVQDTNQPQPPPTTHYHPPTTISSRPPGNKPRGKVEPQAQCERNTPSNTTQPLPPPANHHQPPTTRIDHTNQHQNLLQRTVNVKLNRVSELRKKFGGTGYLENKSKRDVLAKPILPGGGRQHYLKEDNLNPTLKKPDYITGSLSTVLTKQVLQKSDSYCDSYCIEDDISVCTEDSRRQPDLQGVPRLEEERMNYDAEVNVPKPKEKQAPVKLQRLLRQPFSPGKSPADGPM